jgi:hypothetical protein
LALQPSSALVLPSSQVSPYSTLPLPQASVAVFSTWQALSQPSAA